MEHYRSRLKSARLRSGLTLEETGRRVGIPTTSVYEIENQKYTPALDRAARLYFFFGLDMEDAFADFGVVKRPRGGEVVPKEYAAK